MVPRLEPIHDKRSLLEMTILKSPEMGQSIFNTQFEPIDR